MRVYRIQLILFHKQICFTNNSTQTFHLQHGVQQPPPPFTTLVWHTYTLMFLAGFLHVWRWDSPWRLPRKQWNHQIRRSTGMSSYLELQHTCMSTGYTRACILANMLLVHYLFYHLYLCLVSLFFSGWLLDVVWYIQKCLEVKATCTGSNCGWTWQRKKRWWRHTTRNSSVRTSLKLLEMEWRSES